MAVAKICEIDGCDKPRHAHGLCGAHYQRRERHGDPLAGRTPDGAPTVFIDEVLAIETDECVIWPFAKAANGYGVVRIEGKLLYTHRVVCTKVHGEPPTPEHHAAHSCGNGHLACTNKRHLSWKTPAANQADRLTHGTDGRGEKHGAAKLTEADVLEIRRMRGAVPRPALAERFGVSRRTIGAIHNRKSWAWLE